MTQQLQGAKGASTPYEASDTLRSTQRAEIVDLLGEGVLGGLVNGLKSIYLDGVPVENADGSRNFPEFGYRLTLGGPTSEADHGFGDVQTEVGVGVTVLAAVPVVRTITDTTADAVRVTLSVPQLGEQKENGDRVGAAFEFAIDVQSNGGGFVERWRDTVSGKASNGYQRAVRLDLKAVGPAPWDVRVRRITPDSTSSNLVNAFAWGSYTVISGVRMLYRHSAVVGLSFDAKGFSSIPSRWYDVMGVSDWDMPVNYDPLARTVAGAWSGLWKQGWTNNPAWVLYNLIQHPRYGLGQYVTQLPDKWTLYQLALWCDEMLPDGRGGTEPRYTINAAIYEQSEALRLLQDICSVFRGVLMHGGSTLTVAWDAPGVPVASYTPANVVDGIFTYGDGSSAAKKTSCTCWYTDRSQAAKRLPATWDDPELVARYGLRSMEINPRGVATPAQALRMAKWALYTAHYEEQTVTFRVGAEGPLRRLGEIFQISDPAEAGERLGGRIHAATTTTVQLDSEVTLLPGETYTLWVTQPHPTEQDRLVQESRTVTTAAGATSELTVAPAFTAAPLAQTVWVLEGTDVAPTLWRYVGISEARGEGEQREYEVLGVRHEPGKFALVEFDQPLSTRPTRRLTYGTAPVTGLAISETVYFDGPDPRIRASVTWVLPAPGLRYVVAWRLDNGPWTSLAPTSSNTVDVDNLVPGIFEVQVQSLNGLGQLSLPVGLTAVLAGDQSRPDNVAGLGFTIVPGGVRLAWTPDTKPGYAKTRLSYGATFATSTFFWEGNSSDFVVRPPGDGVYTVWAVHVNRRDRTSLIPASIEVPYTAGAGGSDGLNNARVRLYQRKATVPIKPSAAVTYNFLTGAFSGLTEGWVAAVPAGTQPLYIIEALATSTSLTDTIGTTEWTDPVVMAQDGVAGASAPGVSLTANPMVFVTLANSSTPTPGSTTISATTVNISGAGYEWTVDGVVQAATGASLVLAAFAAGTTKLVQCLVTGVGGVSAFDRISIFSLREGSDSINAGLDNENQTVACDNAGNPSPASQFPLTAQAYVVRGAAFLTSGVIYGIQSGSSVGFSSASISASGAVSIAGMTADVASITFTATVGGVTIPIRFTANKSRAGANGTGTSGAASRRAYALYTGNPVVSGSVVYTSGASSLPAFNAWSPAAATSFTATRQTPSVGQAEFISDATYNASTGLWEWQVPYLANFRVGDLSALSANLGTVNAGNITGTANISITGYAQFKGATGISVPAPGTTSPMQPWTAAVTANETLSSSVGIYARSSSAAPAGYFDNSNSFGVGVYGKGGDTGVYGAAAGGFGTAGVRGLSSSSSGSSGVIGTSSGSGTYGVFASDLGSGTALYVNGSTTVTGRITSNYTAGAPIVLPVLSSKPAAVAGGFAIHATYGPIVSNGSQWFAPSALIVVP